ncbi:hypothetical protein KIPB_012858, partial [Kipferlia bialata]|eukprot:g12858.t1
MSDPIADQFFMPPGEEMPPGTGYGMAPVPSVNPVPPAPQ